MPTIRTKSGSTTPTTSDVVDSELAFDRATGKVYIGSGTQGGAATSVVEVGGAGKASSGAITTSGLTMSQDRMLARTTAGSGAIEEIGLGNGLSFGNASINVDFSGFSAKSTAAVDADTILISDSQALGAVKTITRGNLISGLGGGSVTSVGLSAPSIFTVTTSTVTTSGTLTFELNTQAANTVLAGPTTGADNNPTFRALVSADLPDIDGGTY